MEIEQLRQVLRYAPEDAIAAAKLGEQLFRQGDFVEAQKWLALAQERCYLLPDRGNRVAQNLRMLQRKIEQHQLLQQMDSEMRLTTTRSNGTESQAQDGSAI
jgi:Flp pilus assembly protein TadD